MKPCRILQALVIPWLFYIYTQGSSSHSKNRAAAANYAWFGLRILWAKMVRVQKERPEIEIVLSGAKISHKNTEFEGKNETDFKPRYPSYLRQHRALVPACFIAGGLVEKDVVRYSIKSFTKIQKN